EWLCSRGFLPTSPQRRAASARVIPCACRARARSGGALSAHRLPAAEAKMRILVTGSTGFIGRSLVSRLIAEGFRVRCAMRAPATVPAGAEASVVGDIGRLPQWCAALQGVEAVVHLAGLAHLPEHTARADAYGAINAGGTRSLAEAARRA